jgi:Tat protein secretion system quality control protein TatD with DNase activity
MPSSSFTLLFAAFEAFTAMAIRLTLPFLLHTRAARALFTNEIAATILQKKKL